MVAVNKQDSFTKKIKKGDFVRVIAGGDKGREGSVLRVVRKDNKVVIEGVALSSKFMKDKTVVKKERPIHVSNVMLKSANSDLASKAGFKNVDGKKVRFLKKTGEVIQDKEFI